jgi:hypothetical protein
MGRQVYANDPMSVLGQVVRALLMLTSAHDLLYPDLGAPLLVQQPLHSTSHTPTLTHHSHTPTVTLTPTMSMAPNILTQAKKLMKVWFP